jgi:hypothetical protein
LEADKRSIGLRQGVAVDVSELAEWASRLVAPRPPPGALRRATCRCDGLWTMRSTCYPDATTTGRLSSGSACVSGCCTHWRRSAGR